MKKITALVLAFILVLSLAGCEKKTPQTPETFETIMKEAGYEVVDVTDKTDTGDVEVTIIVAIKDGVQLELWSFAQERYAQSVFNHNKSNAEALGGSYLSVSLPGFAKYQVSTSTQFVYIACVGNTMLYSDSAKADQETVLEAVKLLGYE
jgi:hypothetical protein